VSTPSTRRRFATFPLICKARPPTNLQGDVYEQNILRVVDELLRARKVRPLPVLAGQEANSGCDVVWWTPSACHRWRSFLSFSRPSTAK
jgi:hypothetical protein